MSEFKVGAFRCAGKCLRSGRSRDLVVWDKLCTLHTATLFDHARDQRLMFPTTVAG